MHAPNDYRYGFDRWQREHNPPRERPELIVVHHTERAKAEEFRRIFREELARRNG